MTESLNYYPITEDGRPELNVVTANYIRLGSVDDLIKAELSHYSFGEEIIVDNDYIIALPKIFYIDHGNSLILDEERKPIAKTTMVRRR